MVTVLLGAVFGGAAGVVATIWYQTRVRSQSKRNALRSLWHEVEMNEEYGTFGDVVSFVSLLWIFRAPSVHV